MPNVTLLYRLKVLQKISPMYSADFVFDRGSAFRIEPGASINTELTVGKHMLHVGVPFRGNEGGAVTAEFEIKANAKYEITYSMTNFTNAGVLTIREVPEGISPDSSLNMVTVKGRNNYAIILILVFFIFSILLILLTRTLR